MKDPVKRLKQTIAVAIAFLIVYTGIMLYIEQRHFDELIAMDSMNKTEAVRGMIEGYGKTADEIGRGFFQYLNAGVRLRAIRMSDQVRDGSFNGERLGEDYMVVQVVNGTIRMPAEAEGLFPELTPEMITSEYEQTLTEFNGRPVFVTGGRISGGWYCVGWAPIEDYDAYIKARISEERLTEAMESVSDIEIFMIASPDQSDPAAGQEDSGIFLQKTKGLSKYSSLSDLGITREDLKKENFTLKTDNGKKYICSPIEMESVGMTLVCCSSVEAEKAAFLGDIIAQVFFAAVMLAGLITWCYSVQWLVRRESLDDERKEKYTPEAVRKRTTKLALMAAAVVTMFAFTTVMIQYMYQENRIGSDVLEMLQTQIEDEKKNVLCKNELQSERFVSLGKTVSTMLTEDPALLERERLAQISDAISAEYLIVFDENAQEAACSRPYVGFALPADKEDPFYDFRRLLGGIDSIVHESETDMITGDIRTFVGIRCDHPDRKDAFQALVIALPSRSAEMPQENEDVVYAVKHQIYSRMQSGNRMIAEIDPGTHKIVSCSRPGYEGEDVESLGMDPDALKDHHMGFYFLDDNWYFGISESSGGSLYYFLTDSTMMSRTGLLYALVSGLLFLIGYAVTAKYALKEYTEENYELYADQMHDASDTYMEKIAKRAPSLYSLAVGWRNMSPEHKTKAILQILTGIMLVAMILIALGNSPLAGHSALGFVVRGNWSKGLNLFSVIAVLVTLCIEYLAYMFVKVVFNMLYSLTDTKGETVLKLTRSFLNYAMFIGAICVSLSFLGVDTATLLASIGLLSLAISLGAKDIVADILAGLGIVFEKTYSVGDFIQIGDFKGKVLEIGVRSTKVVNGTHDIKIFNNHEIGNVINFSKQTSVCVVKVSVPVTVSVDEMRELFERELPLVGKINPHIVSGPKFDGILELENDSMVIGISAEGPEEHINSIKLDLNQALQSMAERKLLKYTPSNIVVMLDGSTVTRVSGTGETDQDEEAQKEDEEKKDPGEAEKTERRRRGVIRSFKKGERKEK